MGFIELACLQLVDERQRGQGRRGELMGFGSSLQLDGVKPSIKPHLRPRCPVPRSLEHAALLTVTHTYSAASYGVQSTENAGLHYLLWSFIMQLFSWCIGSNLTHLIDAFSLNPAHQKLVKLVCHWNAPLSPLLDPIPLSVNHHLPQAAETFPHIN